MSRQDALIHVRSPRGLVALYVEPLIWNMIVDDEEAQRRLSAVVERVDELHKGGNDGPN